MFLNLWDRTYFGNDIYTQQEFPFGIYSSRKLATRKRAVNDNSSTPVYEYIDKTYSNS